MDMNIYKHEIKMYLKSVATWSVSLIGILFVFMSIYSSMGDSWALLNKAVENFPKELLMAFGMTDLLAWTTIGGFFGFAFIFCQICLAIQASNYGFALVSVEERELTADFLLAKPVSRTTIMTSKLLAAFTALTVTNAVVWIASFAFINLFRGGSSYETKPLVVLLLSIVIFQLVFLGAGIVISLLVKRVRSVTPYSMSLAFGLYVLNAFGGFLGEDTIELASPFRHFDPNYIIQHAAFEMPLVLVSVIVVLVAIPASYLLYSRRNIASAV
jgi:ABC-2 type transport system permease protein